jgi:hypothetical protein
MPDVTEAQIREEHPDWTDEQVAAEVARLAEQADPPAPPTPETGPAAPTQADIDKAYTKLREAEKRAAAAEKRNKEREDAELSETEKLKQEADEGRQQAEEGKRLAREAKTLTALADKGLAGAKAKAALRLLDGIEYDDQHEPTNLVEVLATAKAEYGEDMFSPPTPPRPTPPNINPGPGNTPGPAPDLTAEEVEAANKAGIDPKRYAAMKTVTTHEEWLAAHTSQQQ